MLLKPNSIDYFQKDNKKYKENIQMQNLKLLSILLLL